ncbi:hypothetical protein KUTeg_014166 [Tegillarca granosa]|uniref:Integrase catalytic domain-containing protein n=1 Tax=Tegillarca granosa TaxID=220873 RepID=A0ABQ9EVU7_TEGGR|nr:hypothetical protein KUTeg_014166 [Tegillarca granosa]
MEEILTRLGMEVLIPKFIQEKIIPDIVCNLSKFEFQCLGINSSSEMMKLRIECIKYGGQKIHANNDSFRKQYNIGEVILEKLIETGFSVLDMSKLLSVSERTIYRRMNRFNIGIRKFTDIDDGSLDLNLENLIAEFPRCGEKRNKEALHRIDNDGIEERSRNRLHRRVYNVTAPNHLWHVDTNHKLIRWNFIITGGIDGFSRFVVFLQCVNNNKAETIFNSFRSGTLDYRTPLRVRSDLGLENIKIAEYMFEARGLDSSSMIVGKSTHNQRIERLWRDVFEGMLDPLSDIDIFALHYVFTEKINDNLEMWRDAWNKHKIRTIGSSPICLFTAGAINTPVPLVNNTNIPVGNGEESEQNENQTATLYPPEFQVSERCLQQLVMQCPKNWVSQEYGVDIYRRARAILFSAQ